MLTLAVPPPPPTGVSVQPEYNSDLQLTEVSVQWNAVVAKILLTWVTDS